jgi:hypothetical protein
MKMRKKAVLALLLILALALGAEAAAVATPTTTRAQYLALAETGITQQAAHWKTSKDNWYCEWLHCSAKYNSYPLLTVWGVARMFESIDAAQLASPSSAHRHAVDAFAGQAYALYWNHFLNGFDPYPGDDYPAAQAWFDDNGWLGLAFYDAYKATGEHQWLTDAQGAFSFIAAHGWDGSKGMWWNVQHTQHSGEALAADALLGALLYTSTRDAFDLAQARKWIDWANTDDIVAHGLYGSLNPGLNTFVSYIEAPMVYAQYEICKATGIQHYCARAAQVATTMSTVYGPQYTLAPLYDSIFMQWMMAYDKASGDTHWITVAEENAASAMVHAPNGAGLWLGSWWGGPIGDPNTTPGMFRTMAGTTSLYAWLAYYS